MLKYAGKMTFKHKSSGVWDDLKLCPNGMKILKKYEATPQNPNTKQSVGGEKQFGITQQGAAFFYDAVSNEVPSLFVYAKKNLLEYLNSSEYEYRNPSLDYCNKRFLPSMFDAKKAAVLELNEFISLNFYINIRQNKKTGVGDAQYLMPSDSSSRKRYYDFLKILLSNSTQGNRPPYTCCTFLKFIDTKNNHSYIFMKPEFTKEYTMEELAQIFSRELEGKDVNDCIDAKSSEFAFKFRNQLKSSKDITSLLNKINILTPKQKERAEKSFKKIINMHQDFWKRDQEDAKEAIEYFIGKKVDPRCNTSEPLQKIFFGAPGTGKSFKIDDPEKGYGLKNVPDSRKFRTTFHPDYDYAQFVGAYKPKKELNKTTNKEEITYSFVPQVFSKAYAAAWKLYLQRDSRLRGNDNGNGENDKEGKDIQVFLVIEEINRGNCAQIFGDIFQLLDRKEGHSDYPIDIDSDFARYIKKQLSNVKQSDGSIANYWNDYKNKIQEWDSLEQGEDRANGVFCKIALPPNLSILATMNTSDQSLFPMDSAFKRRFDWEYVPINYDHPKARFAIEVGGTKYDWLDFLEKINENIDEVTKNEDKKLGEFFIKPKDGKTIDLEEFRSKVLFYLWDSVYKDENGNSDAEKVFHFNIEDDKKDKMTFQKLFDRDKGVQYVNTIMGKDHLNVDRYKENESPVTDSLHSPETAINTDIDTAEETTDDTAEPAQT